MGPISGNRPDWRKGRKKPSEAQALTPWEVLCWVLPPISQAPPSGAGSEDAGGVRRGLACQVGGESAKGMGVEAIAASGLPGPTFKMPRIAPRRRSPFEALPDGSGLRGEELGSIRSQPPLLGEPGWQGNVASPSSLSCSSSQTVGRGWGQREKQWARTLPQQTACPQSTADGGQGRGLHQG